MFLMVLVHFTMYGVFFYISHPWKTYIYKNILFLIIVLLNVGGTIAQFYITYATRNVLKNWPISNTYTTILLAISAASVTLGYIYNLIMDRVEDETELD